MSLLPLTNSNHKPSVAALLLVKSQRRRYNAATTTTLIRNDPRNAMPRLYAPKGKARRIELHAGHAEGGRGGERPPWTHILCGDSRRPEPQSRGPIEKTQSARNSVSSREGAPRPSRPATLAGLIHYRYIHSAAYNYLHH